MIIKKQTVKPFDFNGLKILDYTSKLKSSSSFARIIVAPKAKHPLAYSKRSDKYYYVLSGQIEFILNEIKYLLYKSDFCIVKKGQRFSYSNISTKQAELLLIHTPSFILKTDVFV